VLCGGSGAEMMVAAKHVAHAPASIRFSVLTSLSLITEPLVQ
jgi:hypothetical protein